MAAPQTLTGNISYPTPTKTFTEYNTSYSGSDISASVLGPDGQYYPCMDIQTISISDYSDRGVVRRLGKRGIFGYTDGPRTVAGTMIFTVLGDSPLAKLLCETGGNGKYAKFSVLPPLTFVIRLDSEYHTGYVNNKSTEYRANTLQAAILGLVFHGQGTVCSIEDIKTEMTASFMAYDYYPLMPVEYVCLDEKRYDYIVDTDATTSSVIQLLGIPFGAAFV